MNRPPENRRNDAADSLAELESQFILRLPSEHAKVLRELIQSGANNLKDRLSIRIENDMRTGEVRLDHLLLHAKVMDLPTIIESLKTIDNKTFYKTADICQIVICKEDDDQTTTDEETPNKNKKKDPNKVDKKYLYPHGITPPLKNVRKRRFRKTLKKKYVEAPEIEKEVRRLLRVDNEAVHVKWEVINEDEDKKPTLVKEEPGLIHPSKIKKEPVDGVDVVEHDIFGGAVSDSEDETNINIMEMEDTSRLSADSSRLSDQQGQHTSSMTNTPTKSTSSRQHLVTEFSKEMFTPRRSGGPLFEEVKREPPFGEEQVSRESLRERLTALERELEELRAKRMQQEAEVANIENMALRQRFQDILDNLLSEQMQKEQEYNEVRHHYQKMIRDGK